ncbi:MAG: sigma-70 family RNA polymerase sigma factor [Nitrospira sp.]|nr:sigma-70 family RNA polymerase sigma factor [Nitrospira sp.]
MLLKELLALPLPARADWIYRVGDQAIAATMKYVEAAGMTIPRGLDKRLTWAIASNMGESPVMSLAGTMQSTRRSVRSYQDWWTHDASFADLWGFLTRPFSLSNPDHSSTLLNDLALSVLCEQKNEWQDQPSRPLDIQLADDAFDYVHGMNSALVVGYLRKNFSGRLDDPESTAGEAWARMHRNHWRPDAAQRFLGRSRISTMVCQIAHNVAVDEMRKKERGKEVEVTKAAWDNDRSITNPGVVQIRRAASHTRSKPTVSEGARQVIWAERIEWIEQIETTIGLEDEVIGKELEKKVRDCLDQLPPRRRVVAYMVWFKKMRANEVALRLGITKSAVSQHVDKAREELRQCLRGHGFDVSD